MEISNVNQLSDEPDIFLSVYSSSAAVNSRWNVEKKWMISLRASSSRVHTLSSPLRWACMRRTQRAIFRLLLRACNWSPWMGFCEMYEKATRRFMNVSYRLKSRAWRIIFSGSLSRFSMSIRPSRCSWLQSSSLSQNHWNPYFCSIAISRCAMESSSWASAALNTPKAKRAAQ